MIWWKEKPHLLEDVKNVLTNHYPDLILSTKEDECIISGVWHVWGKEKHITDFMIEIKLIGDYPNDLPVVFETNHAIPRSQEFHTHSDGSCCLEVSPRRYEIWPPGTSFKVFLDVLVHNFFFFQACKKLNIAYPYGEWGHEDNGLYEYYGERLDVSPQERKKIISLLRFSLLPSLWRIGKKCPCGSGKWYKKCHEESLELISNIVPKKERQKNLDDLLNNFSKR